MKLFVKHCCKGHNLWRALKISWLVGTILAIINHYDSLLALALDTRSMAQIVMTYSIPFMVSLYSAAMSGRALELEEVKNENIE